MKQTTEVCISEWDIPTKHLHAEELRLIKADAIRCKNDHAKLCSLNPKAAEAYNQQLETTLAELNRKASEIE